MEAIGWYTGTRGLVDEAKARTLIETAAFEGNVLARMWLARLYSRGRDRLSTDEAKAQAIAELLVDAVQRQAAAGTVEAMFLMGTAYDEGPRRGRGSGGGVSSWFSKAAAPRATRWPSTTCGNAYATGRGVAADPVQASQWWLKARHQGRRRAAAARSAKPTKPAAAWPRTSTRPGAGTAKPRRRGNADAAAALKRLAAAPDTPASHRELLAR